MYKRQAIYYTQFKGKSEPGLPDLKKAASAILKLSPPTREFSFAPIAIFNLVKKIMAGQQFSWAEIETWLLKIDPAFLSDQPFKMTQQNGKTSELASQKEEWYSHMIRVKAGLDQPAELLELLKTARKQNLKWHYNNDIWFARKEAFAHMQLGDLQKAESILRKVTAQKKDWFLLYDMAQVVDNEEEKLKLMIRAVTAPGKIEHKVKLYYSLYQQLIKSDREAAILHLKLFTAIRKEKNWGITDQLKIILEQEAVEEKDIGSSALILKEIKPVWDRMNESQSERIKGKVASILPNGKAGFVKAGKNSFYFSMGRLEGKIRSGDTISFELTEGFDKKKNKAVKNAVHIQLEK